MIKYVIILVICRIFCDSYLTYLKYVNRYKPSSLTSSSFPEGDDSPLCRIKVIGVGGGGSNAINRIKQSCDGLPDVEFWVVNTDMQALSRSNISNRLHIGASISR